MIDAVIINRFLFVGLIWRPFPSPPPPSDVHDIYLGGTVDNDDWRKNTAIPLLM